MILFRKSIQLLAGVLIGLIILAEAALAQDDFRVEGIEYNAEIPDPETFMGQRLGDAPVRHHQLVDYLRTVSLMSERITMETIGYSHERRPILFLVVTSPENHARIDEILANHQALSDPNADQEITEDMPVVTWLNYGVHGAEASGMDASLPTVYHLAAAEGPDIEETLQNSVILITAIFNPDGHSRRAAWFDQYMGEELVTDPDHLAHNTAWPGGRTNHYWFDLNRQWLLLTQPEPRAWVSKWQEWRPNLSVDYHEMGPDDTYYFHPGIPSRTFPLVPEEAIDLMNRFSESPAAFMDSEAKLYYSEEDFDNFYIGKGSTYPLVNGGVGILYEAAAGRAGAIETVNGLRSYRENIRTHFRTSLASIQGALRLRPQLLDYKQRFYEGALDAADDGSVKAYVFQAPGDMQRLYHFLDILEFHRIDFHGLTRDVTADGVTYHSGEAFIVPLRQGQYRMIRSIFQTITEFEDATFYDISSWTLPLAFNLQFSGLNSRQYSGNLLAEAAEAVMPQAEPVDEASFAYIFSWEPYYAPKALYRILDAGLLAKTVMRPVEVETSRGLVSFNRGSIMVPFEGQPVAREDIYNLVQSLAAEIGVDIHAVTSGRATGIGDLGGPSFRALERPEVLLIVGPGTSFYDAGEVWHLMDYRMGMPLAMVEKGGLSGLDWGRYTHIVMVDGNYSDLSDSVKNRMSQWTREGGTLIGMSSGAEWVNANILGHMPGEETKEDETDLPPERLTYANKSTEEAIDLIAGTIMATDLDITHPIGFGFADRNLPVHRDTEIVLGRPENPYGSVAIYADEPLISGYASQSNREKLAGTAAIVAERLGNGSVVLYVDNPNFRGVWYGTNKLFLNSLFFSKAFQPPYN